MGLQNPCAIERGGNPACAGGGACGAIGRQHLDAPSRVVEWHSLDLRMARKEPVALGQGYGMGIDSSKVSQGGSRKSDQIVNDPQLDLGHDLQIVAEVKLRIVHNLIAFPGTTLRNLRRVYSHPVALAQCNRFFSSHPKVERVPFYDTAGSVKMLAADCPAGSAAIASRVAASFYRARILKTHLEDHRENFTRFLLLSRRTV